MNELELRNIMYTAQLGLEQPIAIRYPRGRGVLKNWKTSFEKITIGSSVALQNGTKIAVLSIGHIGNMISDVLHEIENPKEIGHYNMRFIKPLDAHQLKKIFATYEHIITIEDGSMTGGFGSAILEYANTNKCLNTIKLFGIKDIFIEHGTVDELHKIAQIDISTLKKYLTNYIH